VKATSVALAMTAVCLGPATASTLAASARISTDKQTGEVRLVYGEVRDATGQFPQEVNTVRITLTTAGYTVTDTTAPVVAGVKCVRCLGRSRADHAGPNARNPHPARFGTDT